MIQGVPVDVAEPGMRLHGSGTTFNVAQALRRVDGAEARDEVAGFGGHGGGEADAAFDDSGGGEVRCARDWEGEGTVRAYCSYIFIGFWSQKGGCPTRNS